MGERALNILQILMIQQFPIKFDELSQKFQVSSRTIRNDVDKINEFLSKNNISLIERVYGEGIQLQLSDSEAKEINNLIFNSKIDFYSNSDLRLLDLILEFAFGELKYIYKKQDEYGVSKSTIDHDMKNVRKVLNEYHLELSINPNTIEIKGSEKTIRIMIFNIINQFLGPIDINDTSKINSQFYQVLFKFFQFSLFEKVNNIYVKHINYDDMMYKNQSILFIVIWVKRIMQGNSLKSQDKNEYSGKKEINSLVKELNAYYRIEFSNSEQNYINLILSTLGYKNEEESTEWAFGQIVTIELIEHVRSKIDININTEGELFSGLFKHIVKLLSRIKNNIQISNPLTEEIKNNNYELFNIIKSYNFKYKSLTDLPMPITEDEIAFIAIYFLLGIDQNDKNSNNYFYKAVVFCNHGNATGKLLAHMLEKNFNIDVMAVLSTSELLFLQKLDYDIVFSTVDIELENIPLLVIDSLLINENYERIKRFLSLNKNARRLTQSNNSRDNDKMFKEILHLIKSSKGNITESVYNELKRIFTDNKIKIDEQTTLPSMKQVLKDTDIKYNLLVDDWKEAIAKTADPLLKKEIITEKYVDTMIESVESNGAYIIIGPNIALAHAKPEDGVNKIGLSVSLLKEPVYLNNDKKNAVRLLFCLAPIDLHRHINIMKDIFNLTIHKGSLNYLMGSRNDKDFKNRLFKLIEGE